MLGIVAGISLIASANSIDPLSTPLNAPIIVVEASEVQERIIPTWLYELEQDQELYDLAKCESQLNEKAINPMDSDGLMAYGLFQYKQGTWRWFQELMGVEGLDIMSGADQLSVTRWAMQNGKASHWGICL